MAGPIRLETLCEVKLGSAIGQCRAVPVRLARGEERAILAVYAADFDVDPYVEMFFYPTDTLKLVLFSLDGKVLWKRDLGPGVIPGMHFTPVFPFDLDADGTDEIWLVNNTDPKHPLGVNSYRLERLDARTGKTTGQWPWPNKLGQECMSHQFRHFIVGGMVKRQPVLVTAQGTYESMHLQGWHLNAGEPSRISPRWEKTIGKNAPGARGSHQSLVVDLHGDGVDRLLWGERAIELDTGKELFCGDRETYRGHSDVIQPVRDAQSGKWFIYTCRESDGGVAPRVALFDDQGQRVWGAVDQGHMDMGWVARLTDDGGHTAMAIRIGGKAAGPDGRTHRNMTEFTFDALTGKERKLPFSVYLTTPVDLDGDGYHELVRGVAGGDGQVLDRTGKVLGSVGGPIALAAHLGPFPGEQVLSFHPDGTLKLWADRNAEDSTVAKARYENRFYQHALRFFSTGWHLSQLAGV